jgi:uncharacterized membrane protein
MTTYILIGLILAFIFALYNIYTDDGDFSDAIVISIISSFGGILWPFFLVVFIFGGVIYITKQIINKWRRNENEL